MLPNLCYESRLSAKPLILKGFFIFMQIKLIFTRKVLHLALEILEQLFDEVEHDIMNYQNRGLCYLPKPKAEADNTDTRF